MKILLINIVFLFTLLSIELQAQEYDWTYSLNTYNQTSVTVGNYIGGDDWNCYERWRIKVNTMNAYNNLEYVSEATKTFNCHYYAWFNTEQYPSVYYWLNYPEDNWLDYSFVSTGTEKYPGKVTYSYSDGELSHSANTTSTSGRYVSKWGNGCTWIHDYYECPYWDYGATVRKWYSRFTISGPTLICSSPNSTFTLSNRPTGTTVTWRKSNNLTYVSGQGTDNYTVHTSSSGAGWIRPTVYFGSDSLTFPQYTVWVGTPQFNISGPYEGCPNTEYIFEASPKPLSNPSFNYSWAIYPNNGNIITSNGGKYAYITFYEEYSISGYDVKVRAQNTCGLGDYSIGNIWIHECWDFMLSPNPASDIVTITRVVSEGSNTKVISSGENTIYNIKIIDFYGKLHYQTTESGDSFTIPVSSLKDGNYNVQITIGDKTSNLKLVVKH